MKSRGAVATAVVALCGVVTAGAGGTRLPEMAKTEMSGDGISADLVNPMIGAITGS